MTKIHVLGSAGYHPSEDRHTSCYMLPEDGIVLDAGTGFFRVRPLLSTRHLDVLLSHVHLDHCCGLTFLLDVLFEKDVERLTVHGREQDLEVVAGSLFGSPLFPLGFEHELRPVAAESTIGRWKVRTRPQRHPGGSLGFRFDGPDASFAYITDTTADPDDADAIDFVRGVDLLIHECNFGDDLAELARVSGHSTASAVATLARRAGVKDLLVGHMNPLADPARIDETIGQVARLFPNTRAAVDHLVVDF